MIEWIRANPLGGVLISITAFTLFIYVIMNVYKQIRKKDLEKEKQRVSRMISESLKLLESLDKEIEYSNNNKLLEELNTMENTKSLKELLTTEPTQEDYEYFVNQVIERVQDLHKDFKFQLHLPNEDDKMSGYAVTYEIFAAEDLDFFEGLFQFAIAKGLKDKEVNNTFKEKVRNGEVIELGEGIEIDGSGTGMTSILQGDDMKIFISFTTEEYREEREEALEEQKRKQEEHKQKQAKIQEKREEAYQSLTQSTQALNKATNQMIEDNPELKELLEKTKEQYNNLN